MSELQVMTCSSCGTSWFPARWWCPQCGSRCWRWAEAGPGCIEETTTVRLTAVRLASVRLDKGPLIIARLEADAQGAARVSLHRDGHGAIWARLAQAANRGAD